MAEQYVVAVPSNAPGGLESESSGHFGHCDVFTLIAVEEGKVVDVRPLPNIPHEQGGCLAPVNLLAQNGVRVLIAGGMGMRPLMGFNNAGIAVFFNNGIERVGEIVDAFVQGQLPRFSQDNTCGGGSGRGGCGGH